MDIERSCLKLLFTKINPERVIENACRKSEQSIFDSYKSISNETFGVHVCELFHNYTHNEWENIRDLLHKNLDNSYGIFGYILKASQEWLIATEEGLYCQFDQLFRWRDVSYNLGQDLFTTVYFAEMDYKKGNKRTFFSWPAIIKTNNYELNNVLAKGLAENHFHLNGSTQVFALNWVSLMNHILGRTKQFELLNCQDIHLYQLCKCAALLRYYFFLRIQDKKLSEEFRDYFGLDKPCILDLDANKLNALQIRIDAGIQQFGYECQKGVLDYAYTHQLASENDGDYRILTGERKLLYDCYTFILNGSFSECEKNLFYAYLLLRTRFRCEFVQVNGQRGFENFDTYQKRKEIFLESPKYGYELVRLAVNATLGNQKITSLEARICPKKTGDDNDKEIQRLDSYASINVSVKSQGEWNKQRPQKSSPPKELFYVLHFPRGAFGSDENRRPLSVRDSNIRLDVYKKTKAIIDFMLRVSPSNKRVRGIDVCSNEINCRPEVFAESFRRLTDLHCNYEYASTKLIESSPRKLHATYHVGEDFLDIVDGLRAIDEVMLFCGPGKGSRLGHALALGINPQTYYSLKNRDLILKRQDLLDNICWLTEKAKAYKIKIESQLQIELEKLFNRYYQIIYNSKVHNDVKTNDYYNSWKLRGDRPELYLLNNKEFEGDLLNGKPFLPNDKYRLNIHIENSLRYNDQYRLLNYLYYYDEDVRREGNRLEIFHVPELYAKLVNRVQNKMMDEIAEKDIAIESNPTSNYLIGSIGCYEDHPIFRFNPPLKQKSRVPLSVSINTDDQGVFDTMLENEYALIALAYEKSKNKNYNSITVLDYIENLRQQGMQQIFQ